MFLCVMCIVLALQCILIFPRIL